MARDATKAKSSRKASDKAAADVPAVDDDLLLADDLGEEVPGEPDTVGIEAESARDKRTHKRLSTVEGEVRRLQTILEEFDRVNDRFLRVTMKMVRANPR